MRAFVAGLLCAVAKVVAAQAANSPLAWRNSADFKQLGLAEFDKFKQLVVENGLQER